MNEKRSEANTTIFLLLLVKTIDILNGYDCSLDKLKPKNM